ncbi:MAG: metalloregulator ArsR/SmtB family transcription factor [Syntrophobacterales bacterium]|nr:metalloregulator ArsR/SmtB family transcription factor [Syntrophobacterales bacterium]
MKQHARLFKSLADETRLQILWLLRTKEELCVCDIMEVLGITQSKASRHLRTLYHQGWVTDRREGVWMYYRLNITPGSPTEQVLQLLEQWWRDHPEAQALQERLKLWLAAKGRQARPAPAQRAACTCG